MVGEAGEDWRNDFLEIANYCLYTTSVRVRDSDCGVQLTGPRAIAAAARPIKPPFRACG